MLWQTGGDPSFANLMICLYTLCEHTVRRAAVCLAIPALTLASVFSKKTLPATLILNLYSVFVALFLTTKAFSIGLIWGSVDTSFKTGTWWPLVAAVAIAIAPAACIIYLLLLRKWWSTSKEYETKGRILIAALGCFVALPLLLDQLVFYLFQVEGRLL